MIIELQEIAVIDKNVMDIAKTGMSEIISISFVLYSCFGERILFTIIPSIGVFCSFAILAAFRVVVSVTLSGEVTRKTLSAAAITGFSSS